jgi:hypothetical protein
MQSRLDIGGMNFITWNKAYCSFPAATLERRELYLVNSFGQGYTDESELLATDGIITTSVTCPSTTLSSYQDSFIALRRIGNKYTLVVDLNVQGDSLEDARRRHWIRNLQGLPMERKDGHELVIHHLFPDPPRLEHPVLKHDYFVWTDDDSDLLPYTVYTDSGASDAYVFLCEPRHLRVLRSLM